MASKPPLHGINFPTFADKRGELTFIEADHHIPFEIKRVFYIRGVPAGESRAGHAHKSCEQVLIPIFGSCIVRTFDNNTNGIGTWFMHSDKVGLYIPPMVTIELQQFSKNCILLVLASEHFDEEDYIRETSPISKSVAV